MNPLVTRVAYSPRCTRPCGRSRLRSMSCGNLYRPSRLMTRMVDSSSVDAGAPDVRRSRVSMAPLYKEWGRTRASASSSRLADRAGRTCLGGLAAAGFAEDQTLAEDQAFRQDQSLAQDQA